VNAKISTRGDTFAAGATAAGEIAGGCGTATIGVAGGVLGAVVGAASAPSPGDDNRADDTNPDTTNPETVDNLEIILRFIMASPGPHTAKL
jgi:hypothetical protein